jgi:hypothetical protein
MPTKSSKAGAKGALAAKNSESSKHLQTAKPKSAGSKPAGKPAGKK